jgi:hypothetical protein
MIRVIVGERSAMFQAGEGMESVLSDAIKSARAEGYGVAREQAAKIAEYEITIDDGTGAIDNDVWDLPDVIRAMKPKEEGTNDQFST